MQIITTIQEMQLWSKARQREGKIIGLVPTMGFLHQGHMSLVDTAKENGADVVVLSIFVNPIQFAPNEDLDRYPRDFEHDSALCEERGVDVIFAPTPEEMYFPDRSTWVVEEAVSEGLCAVTRPTHFRGVTTVVTKLFHAALPDLAVFGQKDAQQAAVLKRMVRDLNFPIRMIVAPIVRESDGLALSSRNQYLSPEERNNALVLSHSLTLAKELIESRQEKKIRAIMRAIAGSILAAGGQVDYVEFRDAETMLPASDATTDITIAVAAYFGKTRLIDNIQVHLPR